MDTDVLVIGAGAAGCMAAYTAAMRGRSVALVDKNTRIGRKLMITGKGRCNLTNDTDDLNTLVSCYPGNGRFLYGALSRFMPRDTMALFESWGVPLKVERGKRVFPVSDKAVDIVDALDRALRRAGVRRVTGRVSEILTADGAFDGILLEDGRRLTARGCVIATGGASYPGTGSTGDGYAFAARLGHTVTPIRPSLSALETDDPDIPTLQGLSLRNTALTLTENGKKRYTDLGELLFTHFGVSGPMVLSASCHIRRLPQKSYRIELDLKPGLTREMLENRILRDFAGNENKAVVNALGRLLPSSIIPLTLKKAQLPPHTKVHDVTREQRAALAEAIKRFDVPVSGFRPVEEAIVTAGGVSVRQIDPKTMASKLVPGVFFAGEVIDYDGYTGGFNLQAAFATGVLAGNHV